MTSPVHQAGSTQTLVIPLNMGKGRFKPNTTYMFSADDIQYTYPQGDTKEIDYNNNFSELLKVKL